MKRLKISDYSIVPGLIPIDVADKILVHIEIMAEISKLIGYDVFVSNKSGYRPVPYEKSKKRTGRSEHCFLGLGAADYACEKLDRLYHAIIDSKYTRIALYPDNKFIHADFASSRKKIFVSLPGNKWIEVKANIVYRDYNSMVNYYSVLKDSDNT